MRVYIDHETDALYVKLADADVHESQEVGPGVVLDYDRDDNVVAIEVLQLSTRRPGTSKDRIEIETA
jgi:uncharacterized protein YuzE